MNSISADLTPWWWTRTATRTPRLMLDVLTALAVLAPTRIVIEEARLEIVVASRDLERDAARVDAVREVLDGLQRCERPTERPS